MLTMTMVVGDGQKGISVEPMVTKRKRIGGPRSRNGCNTCRIRHVKCDETRPGCVRCANFGRKCDGYEVRDKPAPPRPRTSTKPKAKTVVVRPQTRYILPTTYLYTPESSLSPTPSESIFRDDLEYKYFALFRDEVANELSGTFESVLWKQLVPRACHEESSIRHATIAVAALSQAVKSKHRYGAKSDADRHRVYAEWQYGLSLKALRDAVARGEEAMRTASLACLLIYAFENLQGDLDLALSNVQITLHLLHDWLSRNRNPNRTWFSPAPHILEDAIISAFTRLDTHLMSWITAPQPSPDSMVKYTVTSRYNDIPAAFQSLSEAKDYWEHILNRVFYFMATIPQLKYHAKLTETDIKEPQVFLRKVFYLFEEPASELYRWGEAFEPILQRCRTAAGDEDFIAAHVIKIQSLTINVSMRAAFLDEAASYDMFLPDFCEIIALARALSEHHGFTRDFVFDPGAGVIPCLFMAMAKSTDRDVRKEAVDVLHAIEPRREGVWESGTVACIGEEMLKDLDEDETTLVRLHCLSTTIRMPKCGKEHPNPLLEFDINYRP
ncbi:hypothetical protein B7463_g3897, partial [Scytalidium lignicola]